jgi:hypothetical protein
MYNIRIAFEYDDTFWGKAVRWFTKGRVNHVAVLYHSDDWKSQWAVEALTKGVVCRPVRTRGWKYIVTPKEPHYVAMYLRDAGQYVGKKYDFQGFFLFALLLLIYRWFRVKLKHPSLTSKAQHCSELAGHVILPILGSSRDPQWIHPEELLSICEQHPDHFIVEEVD